MLLITVSEIMLSVELSTATSPSSGSNDCLHIVTIDFCQPKDVAEDDWSHVLRPKWLRNVLFVVSHLNFRPKRRERDGRETCGRLSAQRERANCRPPLSARVIHQTLLTGFPNWDVSSGWFETKWRPLDKVFRSLESSPGLGFCISHTG